MKALSVRQPHAARIASGEKPIEFRSWQTGYRGDLLIVASKYPCKGHVTGVTVCVVRLDSITRGIESGTGPHVGRSCYLWHLTNPRPVLPFPVRGKLMIFEVAFPQTENPPASV